MAQVIVRANGTIADYRTPPVTVVGDTPIGDGSDSTWIEIHDQRAGRTTVGLDTLPVDASLVEGLVLCVRLAVTPEGDPPFIPGNAEFFLTRDDEGFDELAWWDLTIDESMTNGEPQFLTQSLNNYVGSNNLASVAQAIRDGGVRVNLNVVYGGGTDGSLEGVGSFVFDLWLVAIVPDLSPCYKALGTSWVGGDNVLETGTSIYGLLDTYTGPSPITDLTIGFTCTTTTDDDINFIGLWAWDGDEVDYVLAAYQGVFAPTPDGAPHDYQLTLSGDDFIEPLDAIRDDLAQPGRCVLRFEVSGTPGLEFVIDNAWLRVGHPCEVPKYPLRVFPRGDTLGPGPGRLVPPPTTWQHGRRYGGGAIR